MSHVCVCVCRSSGLYIWPVIQSLTNGKMASANTIICIWKHRPTFPRSFVRLPLFWAIHMGNVCERPVQVCKYAETNRSKSSRTTQQNWTNGRNKTKNRIVKECVFFVRYDDYYITHEYFWMEKKQKKTAQRNRFQLTTLFLSVFRVAARRRRSRRSVVASVVRCHRCRRILHKIRFNHFIFAHSFSLDDRVKCGKKKQRKRWHTAKNETFLDSTVRIELHIIACVPP